MADDSDAFRKKIAELEKRAETLEKRFARLVGQADQFAPRTTSIMREGIPLDIFSRLALLENDFEVFGSYAYTLYDKDRDEVERSVDIY